MIQHFPPKECSLQSARLCKNSAARASVKHGQIGAEAHGLHTIACECRWLRVLVFSASSVSQK